MDRGRRSDDRHPSFERSTSVIASIGVHDQTIDQCHRVDRPLSFERSTGTIASIDILDQTIDTSHSNDRRRH
jgi:hypothetical protein